tara:strand:+ start:183 stop:1283 length:1101 start_codon:yes stop_codon:yes gene_type:complete
MTDKPKIGIAIAGLGFGESVHLPAIINSNYLKPTALWHPKGDQVNTSAAKYDIRAYSNWSELLSEGEIKGIIIATPPKPRFELAKEALLAGKHLLLEKPVALNYTQIEELQRLSINKKLSVAVDFEYRAVPLFMQAKRLLSSQILGKIWLVKFDWIMSSRSNPSRPWTWYSKKEEGGGVLGALGTHAFDILHWLIGPSASVNSYTSTTIKERPDMEVKKLRQVTSEDICLSQLELLSIHSNERIPAQVTLSSVSRNGRGCWIEIYGSEGSLILGSDNQKDYVHGFGLWLADKNGPLRNISPDEDINFQRTWTDGRIAPVGRIQNLWAESISYGNPIVPGLAEAVESQKVCDKVKQSAESGLKVHFN